METLTEAVFAVTTKIYQKVQAAQQGQAEKRPDDTVVNADFKMEE
jgi:molecular chaperone DnaK